MDILSYQNIGEVFTSAMTGNTALLGLNLGRGNFLGSSRNLAALVGFLIGLFGGFAMLRRHGSGVSKEVLRTLGVELIILLAFSTVWIWSGGPVSGLSRYGLIGLSAVAMGMQTAVARAIGLSGISTTFFTGTLTSISLGAVGRILPRNQSASPAERGLRWPLLAPAAYVLGAAATGFLDARARFLPSVALTALPAATVAIVLVTGLAGSRRG